MKGMSWSSFWVWVMGCGSSHSSAQRRRTKTSNSSINFFLFSISLRQQTIQQKREGWVPSLLWMCGGVWLSSIALLAQLLSLFHSFVEWMKRRAALRERESKESRAKSGKKRNEMKKIKDLSFVCGKEWSWMEQRELPLQLISFHEIKLTGGWLWAGGQPRPAQQPFTLTPSLLQLYLFKREKSKGWDERRVKNEIAGHENI